MSRSDHHCSFIVSVRSCIFLALALLMTPSILQAQFIQAGEKLVASDIIGNHRQGWDVDLSGDGRTAVVSAGGTSSADGGALVYVRQGLTWVRQPGRLFGTGAEEDPNQGSVVAISADGMTIAIGASSDAYGTGAVWVFVRSGDTWVQQGQKLVGTGATWGSHQGGSIALSADGNTMIVGATGDSNRIGAAWIFGRTGGVWTQQGPKLCGTDASGQTNQGQSVCISGDGMTAAVGGSPDDWDSGAVWIYGRIGGAWSQLGGKFTPPPGSGVQGFGISVDLNADGTRLLVGSYMDDQLTGCARVYERAGNAWVLQGEKFVPSDIGYHAQFGRWASLSSDGNTAVIGAVGDDSYRGACWVYKYIDGTWTQYGTKLVGTGGSWNAQQGTAAISGDATTLLVGGSFDQDGVGAVWMFVDRSVDVHVSDPWAVQQPGSGSIVRLFDSNGVLAAAGATDDSGNVSFYAVAPDTGYACTVHRAGPDTTAEFDTLSWGAREAITLVSGRTASVAFERNAPVIDLLDVVDPVTGESVRGSSVFTEIPLHLKLRVRHGHAAHDAQVQGVMYVRADTTGVERVRVVTNSATVKPDSTCYLDAVFTPHESGKYTALAAVMTGVEGSAEPTDVLLPDSPPLFTATVMPIPGTVALVSPLPNAAGLPPSVTLRWMRAMQAARYHVQVTAEPSGWSPLVVDDSSLTDSSRAMTHLRFNSGYRWRVRALNVMGAGPWSEVRSFSTTSIDPALIPVQLAPANNAVAGDSTVVLCWSRPPGAATFRVQVSTDSLFAAEGTWKSFFTSDTFIVARPLSFLTRYWWRVEARNDSLSASGSSGAWSFTTSIVLPTMVGLIRPLQGQGTLDTMTFTWHRAQPGVTRYWFEQALDSSFTLVKIDSLLTDTTKFLHVWPGLVGKCYWRVRARNAAGWGPFSDVRTLIQLIPSAVDEQKAGIPDRWVLEQNYPNPFNPQTVIRYGLPERARVVLAVYNMLGQQVTLLQEGEMEAGYHESLFDARNLPSGVYFYRLQSGVFTEARRLILVR